MSQINHIRTHSRVSSENWRTVWWHWKKNILENPFQAFVPTTPLILGGHCWHPIAQPSDQFSSHPKKTIPVTGKFEVFTKSFYWIHLTQEVVISFFEKNLTDPPPFLSFSFLTGHSFHLPPWLVFLHFPIAGSGVEGPRAQSFDLSLYINFPDSLIQSEVYISHADSSSRLISWQLNISTWMSNIEFKFMGPEPNASTPYCPVVFHFNKGNYIFLVTQVQTLVLFLTLFFSHTHIQYIRNASQLYLQTHM